MNVRRLLLLQALGLLLAGCGLFDSSARQLQRAESALAQGAYGEAVIVLRNLTDHAPDRTDFRLLLARALLKQGDLANAGRALDAAAERGGDAAAIAEQRLQLKLASGDYAAAQDMASDAASPLADDRRRYFQARAHQGLRNIPAALALYTALVAEKPASADLQLRIAQCHAYHGRAALAHAALDEALSLPAADEPPVRAEAWMLKAVLARRAADPAAAADAFRRAVEAAPGELGYFQLGQLLGSAIEQALRAGDIAAATTYQQLLASHLPQSPLAAIAGAQLQLLGSRPADAVGELQQLLQQQPDNVMVRTMLAAGHLRLGSFEQALSEANALVAAHPDSAEYGRVQELIRTAGQREPASAARALAMAGALDGLQQTALARQVLEGWQDRCAEHPALPVALVRLELRDGRTQQALRLAQEIASAMPESASALALLGESQAAGQDFRAAAASYQRIWDKEPSGPLALALYRARNRAGIDDAERPLRQWLETHPRDASIRLELATALQQNGEAASATREFQRLLAELPASHALRPVVLNNLAVLYHGQQDVRALETAEAAYTSAREVIAVQDTLGWLLLHHGNQARALSLLQGAAAAAPTSPEIRYHHAAALAATGDREGAKLLLADVLLDPAQFEGRRGAEQLLASLEATP
jgi:tetratricopeptide (TPR) repeat protein